MSTGYSGKPLADKLGIKAGTVVHSVTAPAKYAEMLGTLPEGVSINPHADAGGLEKALRNSKSQAVFVHCFVTERAPLQAAAATLAACIAPGGMLWVSWPKLAAAKRLGLPGDVSEQTLRDALLPTGLVDVKVCAVDETWSGLKFLWRRPGS